MGINTGAPRYRRDDHQAIAKYINTGDRVLDVGCGDGQLLQLLRAEKSARCQGLEYSQSGVNLCVSKGLSVVQGDANVDLAVYPDKAFDCAILSKTVQELGNPDLVIKELSRISKRIVISFRNYGYWRTRLTLLTTGRMPTPGRVSSWYEEGARRPCTLLDMTDLTQSLGLTITDACSLPNNGSELGNLKWLNLFAKEAILVLE
ncbi:methionine biosynthesis protein MetW [Hirschia litorea]|uniref:Methionine biosynthesis protein MetW n=1 Tax=Hirschia litorea TaxID=1199156 RepID=A0ABW2IL12_9PROT